MIFLRPALLALLLAASPTVAQQVPSSHVPLLTLVSRAAPASAIKQQMLPYLTPQQLVHIEEGRTINLVCLGHGSPTVILTAGLQNWSLAWRLIQLPLAKRTRVCAWDRAGFGFSGPSPKQQDIVHTTEDLERALKGADIRGPYLMVGHSLGGYEALRFTDLHQESVVGMVLVDPAIPDEQALMERIATLLRTKSSALDGQIVKHLQDCAMELRGNALGRSAPQLDQCTADPVVPADFPSLKAAIARLNADPERLLTQASTVREFDSEAARDSREVMNAQRRYGDMPLIVLTAGRDESQMLQMFGGVPPAELAQLRQQIAQFLHDAWVPAHDAYAALSTRGRNQLVPDAGHTIQIAKPDVVISAVTEVLDKIHSNAPHER